VILLQLLFALSGSASLRQAEFGDALDDRQKLRDVSCLDQAEYVRRRRVVVKGSKTGRTTFSPNFRFLLTEREPWTR